MFLVRRNSIQANRVGASSCSDKPTPVVRPPVALAAGIGGRMKRIAVLVALASGCTLAACGSGSSPTTTTTTTAPSAVKNLVATPAIKAALLAAGAAAHHLPVSDYTGLSPGRTFYAYNPADALYWAGAQLVPSTSSQAAQIAAQDDGAYDLFTMRAGGHWTAYQDGFGTVPGSSCGAVVPLPVRTVWGWSTTTPCGGPGGV